MYGEGQFLRSNGSISKIEEEKKKLSTYSHLFTNCREAPNIYPYK